MGIFLSPKLSLDNADCRASGVNIAPKNTAAAGLSAAARGETIVQRVIGTGRRVRQAINRRRLLLRALLLIVKIVKNRFQSGIAVRSVIFAGKLGDEVRRDPSSIIHRDRSLPIQRRTTDA